MARFQLRTASRRHQGSSEANNRRSRDGGHYGDDGACRALASCQPRPAIYGIYIHHIRRLASAPWAAISPYRGTAANFALLNPGRLPPQFPPRPGTIPPPPAVVIYATALASFGFLYDDARPCSKTKGRNDTGRTIIVRFHKLRGSSTNAAGVAHASF